MFPLKEDRLPIADMYTRSIRDYPNISFRFTRGKIDIFRNKQFHNWYEIYLLLNGNVEYINDHTRSVLARNSLVIIPPGEYHRFIVADEDADAYERCVLNVYPDFLQDTILREALGGKELLTLTSGDRIIENFLYLKNAMVKNNEKDFGYILSAVATDIVFLIKQSSNVVEHKGNNTLHPVAFEIMEYINQNYKSKIKIRDIAKRFFLSDSSVSHIFKDSFGVSIQKCITQKRMNEARSCLQNGKKPQDVAAEFGFSNYATFYRNYRELFGIPPSHTQKK